MRNPNLNSILIFCPVMLLAFLITGCQAKDGSRAINIESDSGSGEFYSGEKPGNESSETPSGHLINGSSEASCLGAPPQRVHVGDRAVVSTISDRLIVRKNGFRNATEIARLHPGTFFYIIDGPKCDETNGWTYWKIETDRGLIGWVSEGGDDVDEYFISPVD